MFYRLHKKNNVECVLCKYLEIYITSKPINNQANEDIINIISKYTKIQKNKINIIAGHRSKIKWIKIEL